MDTEKKLQLEKELSYWKGHISVYHMLASELSYSLIYDNIQPNKVNEALATVGLDALPNRFLLIQVDDYQNYSSKLRITQEFFQKTSLVNILRDWMEKRGLEGFAANLVGMDKIICFLCCQEYEGTNINKYLLTIAEELKACVRGKSTYTVSVCISEQCLRLTHYSKMFPRMNLALSKSYFSGKEFSILLENEKKHTVAERSGDSLNERYPEFLASIVRHNREQFEQVLQKMIQTLLESQTQPQQARLEMIRLLQRVEEYCIRCGVPENRILIYTEKAISQILSCSFIADTRVCFREYYERTATALEECSADVEYAFKLPVSEYIAEHYHEPLRVKTLADMMGFSEGHFARMFRSKFEMTFVQYLTQYRIQESQRLLAETHIPIEQIAYQVGINNYSYFCTCFKQACGLSPGAYRKKVAAERSRGE